MNIPDGAYGALMRETAPHYANCEEHRFFVCKCGNRFRGPRNRCQDCYLFAATEWDCVCDLIREEME